MKSHEVKTIPRAVPSMLLKISWVVFSDLKREFKSLRQRFEIYQQPEQILQQPRSQGLSSLPPLVVGTETLVAAGHVTIYPSKTAGWVGTQVHLP